MIDRSESDLIAQEQRNRNGVTNTPPGAAVHAGDRALRRKRGVPGQSVRIEPSIGHPPAAAPHTRPK